MVGEGDPFNLTLLEEACASMGHQVLGAARQEQVLEIVARHRPGLLLLDAEPPVNGLQIIRVLRSDRVLSLLPVILLIDSGNPSVSEAAKDLGAADFVVRPYRVFEIQQRVRNVLGSQGAGSVETSAESADMLDELTQTSRLEQLRMTLHYEHTRALRYGGALSCMVVGVSNLDELAMWGGAAIMQKTLVRLAVELRSRLRAVDQIFRSNVDEFTVLLPDTDLAGARALRKRILKKPHAGNTTAAEPQPVLNIGIFSHHPSAPIEQSETLLMEASKDAYGTPRLSAPPTDAERT